MKLEIVKKYEEFLRNLLIEVEKNKHLVGREFCKLQKVSPKALTQAIKLGYVTKTGDRSSSTYFPNLKIREVEPWHGRVLAESISEYFRSAREKRAEKEANAISRSERGLVLQDCSNQELFEELKRRGFTGELKQTTITTLKF